MCDKGTCVGCRYTSHAGAVWDAGSSWSGADVRKVEPETVKKVARWQLVEAEGGSLPTVIDVFGESALAIDQRKVFGKIVNTPVFASHHIAQAVCDMLNDMED